MSACEVSVREPDLDAGRYDGDVGSTFSTDVGRDGGETDSGTDVRTDPTSYPAFVCSSVNETVSPTLLTDEPFRLFERGAADITRRSDLVAEGAVNTDGSLNSTGTYLTAPPEMRGGRGALRSLFTEAGEDVQLLGGWWTGRDIPESARASLTLLVNYQPVISTYQFMGPEGVETLGTYQGSGAMHPMKQDFMSFEITIPGETFETPGIYDLALRAHVYSENGRLVSRDSRISLYAGGYEIPSHPCFKGSTYSNPTEFESSVKDVPARGSGMVYPSDLESRNELVDDRLDVIPRRRPQSGVVDLTLFLRAMSDEPQTTVWVPLLNAKPVGPARFVYLPGYIESFGPAHRATLTVEIPSEPSNHDLVVGQWFNPFVPTADRFGDHSDLERILLSGTNYLFYVE